MRRKTSWQRRRDELARQQAAAVPDVVRDKLQAEQQMRFFDLLTPGARVAIAQSRFDDDALRCWKQQYVGELPDAGLVDEIRRQDDARSGTFGPKAASGI